VTAPPEFNADIYASQTDLLGRLRALAEEQMHYQSGGTDTTQASGRLSDRIVAAESRGDPNAKNERSTATGPGQFLEKTWLYMLRRHRPDLTGTPNQLLALRRDPQLSREMTEAYAADNAKLLLSAGYEATPRNIYLAHFAGASGAISVLKADPIVPVSSVLSPRVIADNPFLAKMTIGDMRAWADHKMARKSIR
jgi:hypothetical protein